MERSEVNQQSAATNQSSSTPGSVAPPQPEQESGVAPGAAQPQQTTQPGSPGQQQVTSGEQSSSQSQVDYQAEIARIREENRKLQDGQRQYQQVVQQIQSYAQDQQQSQALEQQLTMMFAHADNLPTDQGTQYLRTQFKNLLGQTKLQTQSQIQQLQQQHQQEVQTVAAPLYADHLIQTMGLPPEAKSELLALRNPDLMYQMAPSIKQRHETYQQQLAQYQQQQVQNGRSQEVQQITQNGLANVGGQGAGASYDLEVSDDKDVAAMQILAHLRDRERQGLPPAIAQYKR